jgi:hypothetical protein
MLINADPDGETMWDVKCCLCGTIVARVTTNELSKMLMEMTYPIYCFDCEQAMHIGEVNRPIRVSAEELAEPGWVERFVKAFVEGNPIAKAGGGNGDAHS